MIKKTNYIFLVILISIALISVRGSNLRKMKVLKVTILFSDYNALE